MQSTTRENGPSVGRRYTKPLFTLLAALAYAGAVHYLWGWGPLLAPWAAVGSGALLAGQTLLLGSYLLRAVRLLDFFGLLAPTRLLAGLKLVLYHNLFNNLLPMRSGELSFPLLVHAYFRVGPGRSLPALMWLRVLDLHTVAALGLLTLVPAAGAWAAAALAGWLLLPPLAYPLRAVLLVRLAGRDGKVVHLLRLVLEGLPQSGRGFARVWAWTWLNWGLKLAVLAWVLGQFVAIPAAAAWWGAIGGDLTSVLPVHAPAGFGTYEAGVAAGLLPWGVASGEAMRAAVNLHLFLLLGTLLGGGIGVVIPRRAAD